MEQQRIRVLLIDDHDLARHGLRRMLELEGDLEVVGEASTAEEGMTLAHSLSPDIILMDIKMPNANGLEATRRLKEEGLAHKVIILSLYQEYLAQAIEAGAGGYLVKDIKREELTNAIRRVHKGELVLASGLLANPLLVEAALRRFQQVVHEPSTTAEHATLPVVPAAAEHIGASPVGKAPAANNGTQAHQPVVAKLPEAPVRQPVVEPPSPFEKVQAVEASQILSQPPSQAAQTQAAHETTSGVPHDEEAHLFFPPPVDAHQLLILSRKLQDKYFVELLEMVGSFHDGTWMHIVLRKPIAIKEVLSQLPEVAQVWEAKREEVARFAHMNGKTSGGKSNGISAADLQLVVKIAADPAQLPMSL